MTGLEPGSYGIGGNCSANCATETTAPTLNIVLRHQLGLHIKTWLDDDGFELRRLKV